MNIDDIIQQISEFREEGSPSWSYMKEMKSSLMQQYVSFKEKYTEHLLFFQVGDFYEIYDEDAKTVSNVLGMKLTKREIEGHAIPMCGMPSSNGYESANQLAREGYFVTIISQTKDENNEVTRFFDCSITPGTADSELAERDSQQYICTAYEIKQDLGIVLLDISTGEIKTRITNRYGLFDFIQRFQPKEIHIYLPIMWENELLQRVKRVDGARLYHVPRFYDEMKLVIEEHRNKHFSGTFEKYSVIAAHYFMMNYLNGQGHKVTLRPIEHVEDRDYLYLHKEALSGLDVLENNGTRKKKGSLFDFLDNCVTPFGSRLLKNWLREPLLSATKINQRLQVVDYFYQRKEDVGMLLETLKNIPDVERIIGRLENARIKDTDIVLFQQAMKQLQSFFNGFTASTFDDNLKKIIHKSSLEVESILASLETKIDEVTIIKKGYSLEYDELKESKESGLLKIEEYAEKEKEITGIKGLKLKDNKVLGYFFEIPIKQAINMPEHFVERTGVSNAKRYVTEELKELEERYFFALEEYDSVYRKTLRNLVLDILTFQDKTKKVIDLIATLDILMNFSLLAHEYKLTRPYLTEDNNISIQGGRHPLIEKYGFRHVVRNDAHIMNKGTYLITGPNMGGKSSYLKMIATLTLLAQIGCFVPAKQMSFTPVDRILMRMGANDSLLEQQSTFAMEMNEVGYIVYHATENSLVLLDELGRGTNTNDGIAIAQSVIEYLHHKIQCKLVCSTHYHELIELEKTIPNFYNFHAESKETENGDIALTYKIKAGGSSRSFGIEVAKKSGLPEEIVERAKELLKKLKY